MASPGWARPMPRWEMAKSSPSAVSGVHDGLGPEHLGAGDGDAEGAFADLDVLGPDADGERRAVGERVVAAGERQPDAALEFDAEALLGADRGALEEVHRRGAEEAGDERVARAGVELDGRADLLDRALVQHDDAVGHGHRLDLVVGDVDHRRLRAGGAGAISSPRILTRSSASRLESGSSKRKALGSLTMARPMATRWLWPPESWCGRRSRRWPICRISAAVATRRGDLGLGEALVLEAEAQVLLDAHVRVERVGLEDHRHAARRRQQVVAAGAVDA